MAADYIDVIQQGGRKHGLWRALAFWTETSKPALFVLHRLTLAYSRCDVSRGHCRRLMLPHPDHLPPRVFEELVNITIACRVPYDLLLPEDAIRPGRLVVVGAAVPETAIDEDNNLAASKHDVRGSAPVRDRPDVDPITEPKLV
jgi:hypothetical protein